MTNTKLKSINLDLTERDTKYIIYALAELMEKLEMEIEKDPDGEEDITPMYADDVLSLRDVYIRIKDQAIPVFGEQSLKVSYETL